jgi:hypothetical protein
VDVEDAKIEKLVGAIVTWVVGEGSYVTKTKLLKLLYLFDVEYYRAHRTTFTGFCWKFFHLGPWTAELDPALEGLVAKGILAQQQSKNSEFETVFYRPAEQIDPREPFTNVKDENILRGVLKSWGTRTTGEILDYVYFQTEPMEIGIRNAPLDFSVIQSERQPVYSRSSSGRTKVEIQKLRTKFEAQQAQRKANLNQPFTFTPPNYDEEYVSAMAKLETA